MQPEVLVVLADTMAKKVSHGVQLLPAQAAIADIVGVINSCGPRAASRTSLRDPGTRGLSRPGLIAAGGYDPAEVTIVAAGVVGDHL